MSDIIIGDFEIVAEPGPGPATTAETRRDDAPAGELRLSVADLATLQRQALDTALRTWAD